MRFWHRKICKILKEGGVIICPTDTIYGFLGAANVPASIEKIIDIKHRCVKKGVIIIAPDVCFFKPYAKNWVDLEKIAALYEKQSAPTTYIVPANPWASSMITGGRGTAALRLCKHALIKSLCLGVGSALVSSSANVSGDFSTDSFWLIQKRFGWVVDCCVYDNVVPNIKKASCIVNLQTGRVFR